MSRPLPSKAEETIAFAREVLQTLQEKRSVGDSIDGIACDFAEAVVQLADACVIGLPCDRHGGAVHGQEAEELRAGVEQILRNTSDVDDDAVSDVLHVLRGLRKSLIFLLDRIDARDSLAFREATFPSDEGSAPPA
jgi:hypothetical protein